MIIAIDFDGTLCFDRYPAIGAPMPYVAVTVQQMHADGHYLIINTCREGDRLREAINWLREHNIPFDRVNDNQPDSVKKYGSNARKIFADVYVDDRNLGGFPGWLVAYEEIKKLKTEHHGRNEKTPAAAQQAEAD